MQHIHFKKILVPTDFSETAAKALDHVKWLAQVFYSEVTLLHVGEIPPASVTFPSIDLPRTYLGDEYQKLALEKLEEWRTNLINSGVEKVNIQYLEGKIASTISEYAADEKIDIVVMGTHGTKGLSEFFVGSNAYKLVNVMDQPVLTIHQKSDFTPYHKIVAPLDHSKFSRAKFPYIAELAAMVDAEVEILYPIVTDKHEAHAIQICYDQVSTFLTKRGIRHASKPIEGHFGHETIKYAEYVKADLIVIMSETETTISQIFLGTNAQEVVNHSKVPVITLHPEDKGQLMDMVVMPGT